MIPLLTGSPIQWAILGLLSTVAAGLLAAFGIWLKTRPESKRADNDATVIFNDAAAERFKEFRVEVHGLRNELQALRGELKTAQNVSSRRGDKLNMLRFILMMLIDELTVKDPKNKVLAQARTLLSRVDEEPHQIDASDAMHKAEDAHEATGEVINEIKKQEAGI